MWTAKDLREGDYIICRSEEDRKRMFFRLEEYHIKTIIDRRIIWDSGFVNRGSCRVLEVVRTPYGKRYESKDYYTEGDINE